jgi:hypothetical protein
MLTIKKKWDITAKFYSIIKSRIFGRIFFFKNLATLMSLEKARQIKKHG